MSNLLFNELNSVSVSLIMKFMRIDILDIFVGNQAFLEQLDEKHLCSPEVDSFKKMRNRVEEQHKVDLVARRALFVQQESLQKLLSYFLVFFGDVHFVVYVLARAVRRFQLKRRQRAAQIVVLVVVFFERFDFVWSQRLFYQIGQKQTGFDLPLSLSNSLLNPDLTCGFW